MKVGGFFDVRMVIKRIPAPHGEGARTYTRYTTLVVSCFSLSAW